MARCHTGFQMTPKQLKNEKGSASLLIALGFVLVSGATALSIFGHARNTSRQQIRLLQSVQGFYQSEQKMLSNYYGASTSATTPVIAGVVNLPMKRVVTRLKLSY